MALYLDNSGHYFKEKGSEYVSWLGKARCSLGRRGRYTDAVSPLLTAGLRWREVRGTQGLPPAMTGSVYWGSSRLSFPHKRVQLYITIENPEKVLLTSLGWKDIVNVKLLFLNHSPNLRGHQKSCGVPEVLTPGSGLGTGPPASIPLGHVLYWSEPVQVWGGKCCSWPGSVSFGRRGQAGSPNWGVSCCPCVRAPHPRLPLHSVAFPECPG